MLPKIVEISYEEAMQRFKSLYLREKLPTNNPINSRWFASEFSCACLVRASDKTARIKGTVTFEEWRGHGYGEQILLRIIDIARCQKYEKIEVYSKHPAWFFKNGFNERRKTNWGVSVMEKSL
jgi:N-acetylglutamate synthase-like GNAT family acetyltransferase